MSRLKSAAQRAPQTLEAATELLARFAAVDAQIAATNAQRDQSIAQVNAAADSCLVPLAAERDDLFKQLKAFWAARADELTDGRRRSVELGGCDIGTRLTTPKVVFAFGKDADGVAALEGTDYAAQLLRVGKTTLDKPAILKALDGDDAEALCELGFSAEQKDEFFIAPIAASPIAR